MSQWYRAVCVCVPPGREGPFTEVCRLNSWKVEDLHEKDARGGWFKLWIPEPRVSEVRSGDEEGDFIDG